MKKLKNKKIYKKFLYIILVLIFVGLVSFISASMGVYTKNKALFQAMMIRHVGLGVFGGLLSMYIFSYIDYRFWKKLYIPLYIGGIIISLLVFIPGLGVSHGGAQRWISLGFISFQPAELLKFSIILFTSVWFSLYRKKIKNLKEGLIAFLFIISPAILILAKQRDTSSMLLILFVSFLIYWLRGAAKKHVIYLTLGGILLAGIYVAINPYILERIKTFSDSSRDPYGSSYQIRQSKIAIGSGGLWGRGLGQSIQKFGPYLPESNSDSIFAIYSEEWGFIGGLFLILFYIIFAFFGLKIAKNAPNTFAQNLTLGIVLLIVVQVLLNIAAISGIIPLSGFPLIFMSNGGTALLVSLSELGIILNISRYTKKLQ